MGDKPKAAAGILVVGCLLLIILPSLLIFNSPFESIGEIRPYFEIETILLPPPSEQVAEWPLIGDQLYSAWAQASGNLEGFVMGHQDELISAAKTIASGIAGIGGALLILIVSLIVAGVILATP